ncbi:hypothetical protein PR202_ga27032 [Eleusine coracana subsp. coracana]|uniref:HMA domain-containing protein n=1 Tax=Eleusine coracana subsp. coracana TaxID=191504 RepID=A0AAV5DEV2_ELECO|nr:hypothetical protein PR202_ga27032 [Eleusine coracana subsp. coracana]
MGAGKGGDGGGGADAAAEAPQPVVLRMDLHCAGCAHKVKKAIKRVPGVESVVADVAGKRVVVAGTADAAALKARIEAKTSKAVEVVSAGSGPKKAAESKDGGAGEEKKADKDGGEKKGDKDASPKEEMEKEKKQPPEETKPKEVGTQEAMLPTQSAPNYSSASDPQLKIASAFCSPQDTTVLLKIRLHCDGCADRIRRRIYKFKGVKDVVLDGNAKDEVKVTGTMDVPALLAYLKEKLNRPVEAAAAGKKDGEGKDGKKDKGGDGDKNKDAAAGGDDKKGKAKGIDAAGPSTAAAAAFMAPAAEASTYHVAPPYGYVAYPQGPSYYPSYSYGNADGMGGYSNPSTSYYHHQQQQYSPYPEAGQHQAYPPPYPYHMAPAPQLFSDENPNACSVM